MLVAATDSYPFDWSRLRVREVSNWVDLARESPHSPYFYERCLVSSSAKGKDKARTFKKPKNSFILALVIDSDQWEKYLDYAANLDVGFLSV